MRAVKPVEFALCKPFTSPANFEWDEYTCEPKLDGFRAQVVIDESGKVRVYTRTHHDATGKMVAVERALGDISSGLKGTILDGEAVAFVDGQPDFNLTARIMGSYPPEAVRKQREAGVYISFVAFDLPFMLGNDNRGLPYTERRRLLSRLVELVESDYLRLVSAAPASPDQHDEYTRFFGEGSVLKLKTGVYRADRSKNFLKWKKANTEDVVITGVTKGKGKYQGLLGAVQYGQFHPGDSEPADRGQCSGMTDRQRAVFTAMHKNGELVGRVIEIKHNGVLANGKFRHPQFIRLRSTIDKRAEDCKWT